jgi:D-beta-D-heptose 7-phosphate kinase/D-beta-D-heptose 1-phosphate adenosyltransferase
MEIVVGVPRRPRDKICSRSRAVARVRRWHQVGRRTVFTNGCFDLIHLGHARYLNAARKLGDALIVGVNGDDSVRRLKGRGRPILPAAERAELIAALECVDLVVVFPEDDPGRLIARLQPRVLVKGADWAKQDIIGRDTVTAAGGKVATIRLVPGRSTSGIIRTIVARYGRRR